MDQWDVFVLSSFPADVEWKVRLLQNPFFSRKRESLSDRVEHLLSYRSLEPRSGSLANVA